MSPTEQRHAALQLANERRSLVRKLKQELRTGELTLAAVLTDPPEALCDAPLVDVVRWSRGHGRTRSAWFHRMGRAALRDRVNLMMPVGKASERTRVWVAEYAEWHLPRRSR